MLPFGNGRLDGHATISRRAPDARFHKFANPLEFDTGKTDCMRTPVSAISFLSDWEKASTKACVVVVMMLPSDAIDAKAEID
jgi:hypothetical protein